MPYRAPELTLVGAAKSIVQNNTGLGEACILGNIVDNAPSRDNDLW